MKAKAKRHTVLVVDDEPAVLLTYRMILDQQDYQVLTAGSSAEAMQALGEHPVDLLLCDLSLEEQQSGFEVIDFARRQRPLVRSVLLTGYASKDVSDRAEKSGVSVLFKPTDIQEFLATIKAQLRISDEQNKKIG